MLGVGLSASNPRHASNWNLLFALLGFFAYYNFINLSRSWVTSGRLSLAGALLITHGSAFALGVTLLWWREHGTNRGVVPRRRRVRRVVAAPSPA
jgi:lipopolysaccharide export system permease protein